MVILQFLKKCLRPFKPSNIKRCLISYMPNTLHVGKRAFCKRIDVSGMPQIKKEYNTGKRSAICLQNELLAREEFQDKNWISPILDKGSNWISMSLYPEKSRLDIAVNGMKKETRLEVTRQIILVLFDIFCKGYAHCDFHAKNLFWVDNQIIVTDFEKMESYPQDLRPPFSKSFDLTGNGLERVFPDRINMFYSAKTSSGMAIENILEISLDEALGMLKKEMKANLLEVSKTFQTKDRRHLCGGARRGKIYSSFDLPELSVPCDETQRDSNKRLKDLGIERKDIEGKRLLDLGCHFGGMIFEAQKFTPTYSLGIEYDEKKVELAKQISSYCGLSNVKFIQSDVGNVVSTDIGEKFAIVFCLAIEAHIENKDRLYELLSEVTGEKLYFEGNATTNPEEVVTSLKNKGFKSVTTIGFSASDNYGDEKSKIPRSQRPIFVASK